MTIEDLEKSFGFLVGTKSVKKQRTLNRIGLSMRTLQKNKHNKQVRFVKKKSGFRQSFLLLRPDNLPQLLRPIRNFIQGSKCVISKRSIEVEIMFILVMKSSRLAPGGRCVVILMSS